MKIVGDFDEPKKWDEYVINHGDATFYHQSGWRRVIEKTFAHKAYYLAALDMEEVRGVLPLFLIRSRLFGKYLVSLPFADYGGICADSVEIGQGLLDKAIEIGGREGVDYLELRDVRETAYTGVVAKTGKVTFILDLSAGSEELWRGLRKQVRNRVRKGQKAGLSMEEGEEHLKSFYHVFSLGMRDHGTPVLPMSFFRSVLHEFPRHANVYVVYHEEKPIAAKLSVFFKDCLYLIWSSFVKGYSPLVPNYVLTWEVLRRACEAQCQWCNMGRSSPDSGPYEFKRQWGPEVRRLYWHYHLNGVDSIPDLSPGNRKYQVAIGLWKRLPLRVANTLGPFIARNVA